jgi:citrate synthase
MSESLLDSREAAKRLGIKLASLYVYVSRGLITSHRSADGRHSTFRVEDIERLANTRRARGGPPPVITSISQFTDQTMTYRDRRVADLLGQPFERVAELIWQVPAAEWQPLGLQLPHGLALLDRLRHSLVLEAEQVEHYRRFEVPARARSVIASAAHAIATNGRTRAWRGSVTAALSAGLSSSAHVGLDAAIGAACVLCADHGLEASTQAVRLAASARADLTDAFLAGFGVLNGPEHGGVAQRVHALFAECARLGVDRFLDADGGVFLPGFGTVADPRFGALYPFVVDLLRDEEVAVVERVVEIARTSEAPEPSIDVALGALGWALAADVTFSTAILAMARMVGWTAHYLEEINEAPMRFMAQGIYASQASGAS